MASRSISGPGRARHAGSCWTRRRRSTCRWRGSGQPPRRRSPVRRLAGRRRPAAGRARGRAVVPVGEPLARYTVVDRSGRRTSRIVRRRFEINDGILGWGSTAFAAIGHLENEVLDWRGPHPAQVPGRYAAAGQSGSLTIMPGTYGTSQTGMTDFVPSATDDALLWLHAIELRGCRAGHPAARTARGRPAGQRRDRRRGDPLSRLGRSTRPRAPVRGPRRRRRRSTGGRSRHDHPNPPCAAGGRQGPGDGTGSSAGARPASDPRCRPRDEAFLVDLAIAPDAIVSSMAGTSPGATCWPESPVAIRPAAARSRSCPRRACPSRWRSSMGRPANGCRHGCASWPPTVATCHRSATVTRSTRASSRTPAAT